MDNLQPGDSISNKYGTRTIMAILPGVVALGSSKEPTTPLFWYTIDQLKYGGYELTLNDEPEKPTEITSVVDRIEYLVIAYGIHPTVATRSKILELLRENIIEDEIS